MTYEQLIAIRKANNETQQAFAARVGLSFATVCNFENGKIVNPQGRIVRALAEGYGVTVEQILAATKRTDQPAAT